MIVYYHFQWEQRKKLKSIIRRLRSFQMEVYEAKIRKRLITALLLLESVHALESLNKPRISPARELLVIRMRNEGQPYKNIQADLKISSNSITKILRKYGLEKEKGLKEKTTLTYPSGPLK